MSNLELIAIVRRDTSLTSAEKDEIINKLSNLTFFTPFINGVIGASVGLIVAKYLKLSKTAQVLLTLAGFGLGKYLLDATRKHDKFLQYNEKLKVYELQA